MELRLVNGLNNYQVLVVLCLKTTIRKILEDCYKLDMLNFDHGELIIFQNMSLLEILKHQ